MTTERGGARQLLQTLSAAEADGELGMIPIERKIAALVPHPRMLNIRLAPHRSSIPAISISEQSMSERSAIVRFVGDILLIVQLTSTGCEPHSDTAPLDLPLGTIEEELRIGAINDPDFAFSGVLALEVGPDGSIYSLHHNDAMVRRWSSAGEPLESIGRRGEGPGEFQMPRRLGWHGDSLWVSDPGRSPRISFFDDTGRYLGALAPALDLGPIERHARAIYPARPMGLLGDGTIHGETMPAAPVAAGTPIRVEHVRMRPDGSTIDTVLSVTYGRETTFRITFVGGMDYGSPQPFADGVLVALANDGKSFLVVERSASGSSARSTFHVHRIGLNGDTIDSRAYPYLPVAIPRDTIESHIQARVERVHALTRGSGTSLRQTVNMVREAMHTPDFYPPVGHVVAGSDGTVWLSRQPDGVTSTEWLVLDAGGEPIGRVEAPSAMRVMMAEQSTLWGAERNEFDVDYIVRYRIRFPEMTGSEYRVE